MILVVDIDGTLSDAQHRADTTNTLHWVAYNSASVRDTPRPSVISLVNACYLHNKDQVILLTSRGAAVEQETRRWMETHGVYFDRLIMRNMNDHRPSVDYKREWFRRLKPDLIIEDCPQIWAMARHEGFNAMLINSTDPFVTGVKS
ncbi:MAG: hypothetical protein G3W58_22840 [Pantoea ananatis]|nr:hypothetical protein [Pantoea ananatis]